MTHRLLLPKKSKLSRLHVLRSSRQLNFAVNQPKKQSENVLKKFSLNIGRNICDSNQSPSSALQNNIEIIFFYGFYAFDFVYIFFPQPLQNYNIEKKNEYLMLY